MTSSENFASIEQWTFKPSMTDTWLAEYVARDAETLTKALQKSFSAVPENTFSGPATPTPTVSGLSGSDHESAPKRQRVTAGKISKRKSRASKRSQTTFITADPANFRQMVQQVTGVRFNGGLQQQSMVPILKPEPQRAVTGGRFPAAGAGCLPTLDTSALLLDHHRQQQHQQGVVVGSNLTGSNGPEMSGLGPLPFGQPNDVSFGSTGLDFETFSSCFPTLESSWKIM